MKASVTSGELYNADAERSVISACLIDGSRVQILRGMVQAADFYNPAHGLIWESIIKLADDGSSIDVCTLADDLRTRGKLNTVGGVQYLGDVTDDFYPPSHCESHARIVSRMARSRDLVANMQDSIERIRRGDDLGAVARSVNDAAVMTVGAMSKGKLVSFHDALIAGLESIYDLLNDGSIGIYSTGMKALDKGLGGGLRGKQLVVIAGRPGSGKTSLAENMVTSMATAEKARSAETGAAPRALLFVSLEMDAKSIAIRRLCADTGTDQSLALGGRIQMNQLNVLAEAAQKFADIPMYIADSGTTTLDEVRAHATMLKARHGLIAVAVDYIQIMKTLGSSDNRAEEIGKLSRELKRLAMELDVPVIALSQLNRQCEARPDKRPMLSDLKASGDIEQDADVVLLVFRPEMYKGSVSKYADASYAGKAEIIIAKQRNGAQGSVNVAFDAKCTLFKDDSDEPDEFGMTEAQRRAEQSSGGYQPPADDDGFDEP